MYHQRFQGLTFHIHGHKFFLIKDNFLPLRKLFSNVTLNSNIFFGRNCTTSNAHLGTPSLAQGFQFWLSFVPPCQPHIGVAQFLLYSRASLVQKGALPLLPLQNVFPIRVLALVRAYPTGPWTDKPNLGCFGDPSTSRRGLGIQITNFILENFCGALQETFNK